MAAESENPVNNGIDWNKPRTSAELIDEMEQAYYPGNGRKTYAYSALRDTAMFLDASRNLILKSQDQHSIDRLKETIDIIDKRKIAHVYGKQNLYLGEAVSYIDDLSNAFAREGVAPRESFQKICVLFDRTRDRLENPPSHPSTQ